MSARPFERWCLGRRSVGERRLSPADQATLERLRFGLRWRLVAPGAGVLALWTLVGATLPEPAQQPGLARLVTPLALTGGVFGLALAVLYTRDTLRETRDLNRDLLVGLVERFAPLDPTTFRHTPAVIEVRRPSGRMLTGPVSIVGRPAPVREVAPGPLIQFRVEEPAMGLPAGSRLERRHLSPEERIELRHAVREVERLRGADLVLLVWFALCLLGWQAVGQPRTLEAIVQLGQGLVAGGIFLWRVIGSRMLSRRMRADLKGGFAVVFVPPAPEHEAEEVSLPCSQLTWSLAGLPADWRGSGQLHPEF